MPECPFESMLPRLLSGSLTELEEAEVSLHLAGCTRCREMADCLSDDPQLRAKYGGRDGGGPWAAVTVCLQKRWDSLYGLGEGGELPAGLETAATPPTPAESLPPPPAALDRASPEEQRFLEIGRLKLRRVL